MPIEDIDEQLEMESEINDNTEEVLPEKEVPKLSIKEMKAKAKEAEAKISKKRTKLQAKIDCNDAISQIKSVKLNTYTKVLVFIIVLIALIDLQLSYVLAFMDKMQIAESLSSQVCMTILGTAFIYMIRAFFDTYAEERAKQGEGIGRIRRGLKQSTRNKDIETLSMSNVDSASMSDAMEEINQQNIELDKTVLDAPIVDE